MSDPYAAPAAALSVNSGDAAYQPRIFTLSGRIGRLRYLGYSMLLSALVLLLGLAVGIIMRLNNNGIGLVLVLYFLPGLISLVALAVTLLPARRRLNDMNRSGWLALLLVIPIVNFFMAMYLLFGRGTDGVNRHGPMPGKNPRGLVWMAVLLPIVCVVVVAGAIPAYRAYLDQARAAAL